MTWIEKQYGLRLEEQPGFNEFIHEYKAAIKEVDTKLETLSEDFAVRHDYSPIHHIEKRLKTPKSIEGKLRKLECDVTIPSARENILDIAGIRVVCNFVDDVYEVANMLTFQDDTRIVIEKDYIKNPKPNGYRSLHLLIMVPVSLLEGRVEIPVEVQIRTVAMDFWASLEHQLRYKKNTTTMDADMELKACAEVSASLDRRMQKLFNDIYWNK